jgi:dihydroflavonol-4-reductase
MTTLVTGATGFVGGQIARALHRSGEKLRILVRSRSSRAGLSGVPVEEVQGDVRDLDSVRRAVQGVDRVVHAAAATRLDPFAPERLERINVEGTRHVLAASREARIQRLLYVSSTAAVASGTLDRPADEASVFDLAWKGPYWRTKHAAEELVLAAARAGELDAVVINPSYVLGPGDLKPTSDAVLLAIATGLVVAFPSGGSGFVDVRDVADGALLALAKGRSGQRYILSGENLTFRQLIELAALERGLRSPMFALPRGPALLLAHLGDTLGPRFPTAFGYLNSGFLGTLFDLSYVCGEKARRELGFSPRPVREAIHDAYRWFEDAGRLPARRWLRRLARRSTS